MRVDDLLEFQTKSLRINHQNDAAEWPPFDPKRHSRLGCMKHEARSVSANLRA
jgi:hypothetical protein